MRKMGRKAARTLFENPLVRLARAVLLRAGAAARRGRLAYEYVGCVTRENPGGQSIILTENA